jgi:nuclear cap-binding protein subunit 1
MDEECQSRFSSWFSLHLSNFGYKWNWADWSDDFQEAKKNSKALFIQETLQKLVKLSYYDRLVEAFPEAIKPLTLTPVFPGQPEYFYSFAANAGAPDVHVDLANRMVECIRLKTPYNDMLAFIEEIKEVGGEALARDILLQTTLFLGSKSFSFLLNMLERNLKVLQVLASTPEAKLHCIRITYAFWVANKQLLAITLDKMVNYKIIDAHSVVSWIFEDMKPDFTRVYVWEILKLTVSKISGRIVAWKEKVKAAESSSMEVEGGASASSARETLENLQRDQKQLFINIFQSFLKAYKENAGKETDLWKAWCIGMFTEVAREFHWELKNLITTLDMIVFSDIDDSVAPLMDIWNKVKLMHK